VAHPWVEDPEALRALAIRYLDGDQLPGWEPTTEALQRLAERLMKCDAVHVAAVSHGTVLTLYAAATIDGLDVARYWSRLEMPDAWLVNIGDRTLTRVGS